MQHFIIYPSIYLDGLMEDPQLKVVDNCISLKGEESSINIEGDYDLFSGADLDGSLAVLTHLAEKYGYMFIAAENLYEKGYYIAESILADIGCDSHVSEMLFIDFATHEMLNFNYAYGWSKNHYNILARIRRQNRADMEVESNYSIGDVVRFDYCGPDYTSVTTGTVIFANKHHAIVQIPCLTAQLATELNRDAMPAEEVEEIIDQSIDQIRLYEHDCFVDMYNALTFLPRGGF